MWAFSRCSRLSSSSSSSSFLLHRSFWCTHTNLPPSLTSTCSRKLSSSSSDSPSSASTSSSSSSSSSRSSRPSSTSQRKSRTSSTSSSPGEEALSTTSSPSESSTSTSPSQTPKHRQQPQPQPRKPQQPLHSSNPFAKPLYVLPPYESTTIETERKRAEQLLTKSVEKLQEEAKQKELEKIEERKKQDELDLKERAARRAERAIERKENRTKQKKMFQLFKNGLDGVTDTEALSALLGDARDINIEEEVRKGMEASQRAMLKEQGVILDEFDEEEDDESDIEFASDGEAVFSKGAETKTKTKVNIVQEMKEEDDDELNEKEETESEKEMRIEREKAAFEFQRQMLLQERMQNDLPQTPILAEPSSVLVGDVLMPFPFKPDPTKIVRVAILGTPNAGKSSLVNALTGSKVTAVSPKRNTTRMKTLGVCTRHDTQMVLYDTPGILDLEGAKRYERDLTAEAWGATNRADVVVVLIDAVKKIGPAEHSLILKAKKWKDETGQPCVLVLNKCDLEHPKTKLMETADALMEICDFTEVYYVAASINKFVDGVQEYLFGLAQPGPWQFPANEASALTEKQRAAEIIREKIYCRLNQEIPYAVTQVNDDWRDVSDGSLIISQRLLVETPVQQSILIGKKGAVINTIKESAEKDLAAIFGRPVILKLTVGVQ